MAPFKILTEWKLAGILSQSLFNDSIIISGKHCIKAESHAEIAR